MAFIPTANAARLEVRHILDSQLVENVFWFVQAGFSLIDLIDLVDTIDAYWTSTVLPLLNSALEYTETYARGMRLAIDIEARGLTNTGDNGGHSDFPVSNNNSFSVEHNTPSTGRSNRGRHYALAISEDQIDQNTLDPAFILAYLTAIAGMGTETAGIGWDWVVCSQYSGVDADGKPIPRAAGITRAITSVSKYDNIVDSQRRRLPGRGG